MHDILGLKFVNATEQIHSHRFFLYMACAWFDCMKNFNEKQLLCSEVIVDICSCHCIFSLSFSLDFSDFKHELYL